MGDLVDRPAQQADLDDGDQGDEVVRLDLGGWISGPCLDPAALELPADGQDEQSWAWPADEQPRSSQ